jgi:Tfp pilus assembly protein PilV
MGKVSAVTIASILNKRQFGFSLIEAMLAFLLVGFGLIGLARLQTEFFKSIDNTRIRTSALNYAQQKIEELRSFALQNDYVNAFDAQNGATDNCDPLGINSPCQGVSATLQRTIVLNDCAGSVPCRLVQINVTWMDSAGSKQVISLGSYISGLEPVKSGVVLAE